MLRPERLTFQNVFAQILRRRLYPTTLTAAPAGAGRNSRTEPGVPLRSPVGVRSSTPGYRLSPLPGRALGPFIPARSSHPF
jgi:hypothetical protein